MSASSIVDDFFLMCRRWWKTSNITSRKWCFGKNILSEFNWKAQCNRSYKHHFWVWFLIATKLAVLQLYLIRHYAYKLFRAGIKHYLTRIKFLCGRSGFHRVVRHPPFIKSKRHVTAENWWNFKQIIAVWEQHRLIRVFNLCLTCFDFHCSFCVGESCNPK